MSDRTSLSLCGEWRLQHSALVRECGTTVSSLGFPVES